MEVYKKDQSGNKENKNLIEGRYLLPELLDIEKLEYFFNLFTASTGFTASLILHPEHSILIKAGCRKLCQDLKCIDPENARSCIAEDLLLDSEIREMNEITMRISGIGLADGALPVFVKGVHCANIISGHVFLDKPNPEAILRAAEGGDVKHYIQMTGGIENIPVVREDVLKASLILLRDMTVLLAEQNLNRFYKEALEESEIRYRMLADFTGEIIYDRDLLKGGTHWAGHSDEMSGFSIRELEEMGIEGWRSRIHADYIEKVIAVIDTAMEEHSVFSVEYIFIEADGTAMHVEESGGFLYDESHKPVRMLGLMKDITDRVLAAEERIHLERKLLYSQKMESLGIMAGGIAHDFNNLLMGIMGSIEIALLEVKPETRVFKNLKRAMSASRRAADITAQMLAYSGRGHFVMSRVKPINLLSGMSDILRSTVQRTISIRSEIPENLPEIMADIGQFQQVMINLVTNSSEAIGDNPGEIIIAAGEEIFSSEYFAKNRVAPELKPGRYVFIDISDNGCGIDQDIQKKLFEPFFSTKQTGRGLGLPAVQGIMKGHGGAVLIESRESSGTRVRIIFPAFEKIEVPERKAPRSSRIPAPAAGADNLVLVVDDEDVVRDLCMEFVRIAGCQVIGTEDGIKGVEIFRRESDHLACVLLDLSMPKMDGVTAFHEMKKINPDVPVILCSGYSEEDATRSFSGEALAGFLQKPYKLEVLKDKLRAVINNIAQ